MKLLKMAPHTTKPLKGHLVSFAEVYAGLLVICVSLLVFPDLGLGNLALELAVFSTLVLLALSPSIAVMVPWLVAIGLWSQGVADHTALSALIVYIAIAYSVSRGSYVVAGLIGIQWVFFGYVVTRNMTPRLEDFPGVFFELLCFAGAAAIGRYREYVMLQQKGQRVAQRKLEQDLRTDIAHYLHDNMARTLTMISMQADLARLNVKDEKTYQQLEGIAESGRVAIEDLRQLVAHLIDRDGKESKGNWGYWNYSSIGESIESTVKLLQDSGYNVQYSGVDINRRFPRQIEIAIILAFSEVTTNLIKYAPVRTDVEINVEANAETLIVEVSNFYDAKAKHKGQSLGIGIGSITDRMKSIGGSADFITHPDRWHVKLSVAVATD